MFCLVLFWVKPYQICFLLLLFFFLLLSNNFYQCLVGPNLKAINFNWLIQLLTKDYCFLLSSRQALKKYVQSNNDIKAANFDSLFNTALRKGVETGDFLQPKGPSGPVKLAKKEKPASSATSAKVTKKTTTKKAAAPKKAATKKAAAAPKKVTKPAKKATKAKAEASTKETKAAPKKKAAAAPKKKAAAPKKVTKKSTK